MLWVSYNSSFPFPSLPLPSLHFSSFGPVIKHLSSPKLQSKFRTFKCWFDWGRPSFLPFFVWWTTTHLCCCTVCHNRSCEPITGKTTSQHQFRTIIPPPFVKDNNMAMWKAEMSIEQTSAELRVWPFEERTTSSIMACPETGSREGEALMSFEDKREKALKRDSGAFMKFGRREGAALKRTLKRILKRTLKITWWRFEEEREKLWISFEDMDPVLRTHSHHLYGVKTCQTGPSMGIQQAVALLFISTLV